MDGVPIAEDAVAMWTERLQPLILERKATFFEATTAIAFADFAARGAEIAVVEVGLGGRLDSTNVLRPLVSAVTKIERDHMKYLGDTLELIAAREGGDRQAGRAVRRRRARPGAGATCSGARRRRRWRGPTPTAAPTCGCCRRSTSGPDRSASRARTSAGTPPWPTGS